MGRPAKGNRMRCQGCKQERARYKVSSELCKRCYYIGQELGEVLHQQRHHSLQEARAMLQVQQTRKICGW